ncbi:Fic family protein [Azospirillum sp.]|uniref:Fic family protein n=1 Tax=Azospirillum sp. TaxID=34012 RepID=UPI002D57750E|nr:Fic family protein [Azospirillum sp.]HYD64388.1 Fic family protein [Azospirillum sp.]
MDDLERLRDRWHALRARFPGSARAFDAWYDVELTYTSNAIEGGTLTRRETALVIEKEITVAGKPLRDHLEAVDHHHALGYIRTLASAAEPVRESDVREIHRLILGRSLPGEAGRYSDRQRFIAGSDVRFPTPAEIAPLMGDFGQWLQSAPPSPDTAFEAHHRLVTIHPFSDGNGRTARLLMNLIMLKAGYPPVAIGPEVRQAYLDAVERRQQTGDTEPYRAFMRAQLVQSLERHVAELEREETDR